jgi:eukaryotic-like serine/threonine-protein kinase
MSAAPDIGAGTGKRRVGRYELVRRLAVGGMAEIYLARVPGVGMEGFEKLIVVKRILPQHALDPELLRMFLDEARLTATLTHPHVTEVYDVGTSGVTPFFTMEYVHGANLRQLVRRARTLPLNHAVQIVASAAAGLHYAHEKLGPRGEPLNIVHRDVSPSNVLVSFDGAIKVSDFGIAKWTFQRTQTQDGALKGKFAYMSPEQCRGLPLDRRSDVFALGTILYELTTGAAPFASPADFEILTQIVAAAPPAPAWPAGGPEYPPALAAIVARALARDPADRYPTAQALQVDLESFARADRLEISTVALAAYVQQLFADELEAWRAAQRAGKTLGDHLAQNESGSLPREPSPTIPTATDAFVAARPPASSRRRRTALAAALALGLAAGGLVAATRARPAARAASTPAEAARGGARAGAPTTSEAAPAPAGGEAGGTANDEHRRSVMGSLVGAAPSSPVPASARSTGRRAARARASSPAAAPPQAPEPSSASRLGAWDPDSPVPP